MIIYEKPGYIQVVHRPELNYIVFDWTNFLVTLAEIKELHQKALATAQEKHCYYYVAETSRVTTTLRPEVIRWWADEWVASMAAAGIRGIVTVVPKAAIAALSTHSWQSQVINGIEMKNVKSLAEAEAVIQQLRKAA
jgi:hypothetical protein